MSILPYFDIRQNRNYHPHVVILGAGASFAAQPKGDKYGRKLPTLKNIVEVTGIESNLKKLGVKFPVDDFEDVFDTLQKEHAQNQHFLEIKEIIYNYFSSIIIPDELTLYDKLILSLRETDLIATFNWDPLLCLAYQRNRHIKKLPNLAFLHGNVFVGQCEEHGTIGFINSACSKCFKRFKKVDLLYPIKEKNYNKDKFIKQEWKTLQNFLEIAFMITIFGYSAPKTDVAARELMFKVWSNNKIRDFGEIQIIDVKPEEEVRDNWYEFFVRHHYSIIDKFSDSFLHIFPRRSCEAWASAVLQNDPWGDIKKYDGNSLKEYQDWILGLIESENRNALDKKIPLSRW
ncbi:hypothetical protein ACRTDU_06980 [Sunxiuqinia elliptica]